MEYACKYHDVCLPCECSADLCADGLPLLPALPGEAGLSWRLVVSATPLLGKPVPFWGTGTAAQLQSQGVLPLDPAGQGTWTKAKQRCVQVGRRKKTCKDLQNSFLSFHKIWLCLLSGGSSSSSSSSSL